MFDYFGNNPFLRYQEQASPDYALLSAHNAEEQDFKHTVRVTPLAEVLADANITPSHTTAKVTLIDE